jgi:hypothetical protein
MDLSPWKLGAEGGAGRRRKQRGDGSKADLAEKKSEEEAGGIGPPASGQGAIA